MVSLCCVWPERGRVKVGMFPSDLTPAAARLILTRELPWQLRWIDTIPTSVPELQSVTVQLRLCLGMRDVAPGMVLPCRLAVVLGEPQYVYCILQ